MTPRTPWLLAALTIVILTACAPLLGPQFPTGSSGVQDARGWDVTLEDRFPGAVISSSEDISSYTSTAPCRWQSIKAGEQRSVACNTPNKVRLETRGKVVVRVLDFPPITGSP